MTLASQGKRQMESVRDCQHMVRLQSEFEDFAWKGLFRVGGIAALTAGLVFRRNLGAELTLLKASGIITARPVKPPATVPAWFTLLQSNPLVGLTWLNVFDLVNYALVGLMFLALFAALRRVNQSAMVIAAALGLAGISIYFAWNQAFTVLSLSNQYAAAATEAQRTILLADGQALLAINRFNSLSGDLSLLLIAIAGLIASIVMLRSDVFSRSTAYVGILASAFDLAYCLAFACVPAVDGERLAICFIPAAGLFLMIWHILIGRRLYQLGHLAR